MKRTLMSRFLTCFSICLLSLAALASVANAGPPRVLLGTADPFAILAGSNITNTGPSVINGDVGLHPGTSVTGFPPGTVNGAQHITDAVALKAKSDLVAAYNDAAGRPLSATTSPDLGGQSLKAGVYRTGSVPALGLTGNLTLDAEGDPNAVFIFQIASTLVTATDSSVSLINGAQACNVYWQVGSSATLGTRTAFKGNILALTSISVLDSAAIEGRLLARNGAVTLINDTINRAQCAPGTDGSEGGGPGDGSGGGARAPGPAAAPVETRRVRRRESGCAASASPSPARAHRAFSGPRAVCTSRNFKASVRLSDRDGIRRVRVYIDGKLVKRTKLTRFSLQIDVRGLRVGSHRIVVVAFDRAGNRSVSRARFGRCALQVPAPRYTG